MKKLQKEVYFLNELERQQLKRCVENLSLMALRGGKEKLRKELEERLLEVNSLDEKFPMLKDDYDRVWDEGQSIREDIHSENWLRRECVRRILRTIEKMKLFINGYRYRTEYDKSEFDLFYKALEVLSDQQIKIHKETLKSLNNDTPNIHGETYKDKTEYIMFEQRINTIEESLKKIHFVLFEENKDFVSEHIGVNTDAEMFVDFLKKKVHTAAYVKTEDILDIEKIKERRREYRERTERQRKADGIVNPKMKKRERIKQSAEKVEYKKY